ncbi:unnamed protein product [Urochloa decumbens]|uniref:Uncharacterized protein n=1 Tax=Urochloa decumbens TaxID=240449 RepID=A0ABC9EB72_9POAL
MARRRQEMRPNYLRELPPDEAAAAAAAGRRGGDGIRLPLLDAGRVLMLWGCGTIATAAVSSKRNRPAADEAAINATYAFLGLLLWLLGVSLITFTPAPRRRFLRVARQGGAAVTNLVMGCFFPPWN